MALGSPKLCRKLTYNSNDKNKHTLQRYCKPGDNLLLFFSFSQMMSCCSCLLGIRICDGSFSCNLVLLVQICCFHRYSSGTLISIMTSVLHASKLLNCINIPRKFVTRRQRSELQPQLRMLPNYCIVFVFFLNNNSVPTFSALISFLFCRYHALCRRLLAVCTLSPTAGMPPD